MERQRPSHRVVAAETMGRRAHVRFTPHDVTTGAVQISRTHATIPDDEGMMGDMREITVSPK